LIYGLYILKKDSVDGRFLIWKVSVQMLTEHTLGVGLGNFPGAYGNAQALYLESHTADKFIAENTKYAFNEYLQILVESGIISFLLFGIIIFSALRNMFRANDFSIFTSLISLLLFALFSYPFSVLPFLIVIMFLLGSSKGSQQISTDSSKSNKTLFFPLFFFFLVVCCTINRYPVYRAYQKWHDNKELFGINNYNETVTAYEALYPYLSDQVDYLFEYAQSLSNSKQFFTSNLVLERAIQISCDPVFYIIMGKNYQALKQYDKSEQCFLKASQIVPNRIYPHYLLAKLYVEMNLTDKVKKTALVVIHQCPKIQSIMVKEMKKEMEQLIKITE
jgi:tetratricopeptide (TPR) repeat protein